MSTFDFAKMQGINPALYEQIQPHVHSTIGKFGSGRKLKETDINRMMREVMANSQFHKYPPAGYNEKSLSDMVRLLILLNLHNNYGYDLNPFWRQYYGGIPHFLQPFLRPSRPSHGRHPHGGHPPHNPRHGGEHGRPSRGGHNPHHQLDGKNKHRHKPK